MTFGITENAPNNSPNRIARISVRIPRLLHEQVQRLSGSNGESVNTIIVQAVQQYLGAGGPATDQRIEQLEADLTRAVEAFASAAGELDEIKGRVDKIERLARSQGADV